MRIEIHARQFELPDNLRQHIERRLQFALSWADHSLQKVTLRLQDINGPKGGLDKSCLIQVPVVGSKPVVIEEIQADWHMAIDRAIERAGRAVNRTLERRRQHSHKRYRAPLLDDNLPGVPS